MKKILVHSSKKNYLVILNNSLSSCLKTIKKNNQKHFILIDKKIFKIYQPLINQTFNDCIFLPLKGAEKCKSLKSYSNVINLLLKNNFTKDDCIIGCGGGTITDLAGYVAATYKRGIKLILIPTTTLAMVDASIGGKNALNVSGVKNAIGTIYPPNLVLIGLDALRTLDQRNINNGLYESIKIGLVSNKKLFNKFFTKKSKNWLNEMIYESILTKKKVVEEDELDLSKRKTLNFGHTFGHAIEASMKNKILHGEAIANGMLIISKNKPYYQKLLFLLKSMNCPIINKFDKHLISLIKNDKKNNKNINLIIVDDVEKTSIKEFSEQEIGEML